MQATTLIWLHNVKSTVFPPNICELSFWELAYIYEWQNLQIEPCGGSDITIVRHGIGYPVDQMKAPFPEWQMTNHSMESHVKSTGFNSSYDLQNILPYIIWSAI